jgi:Na+/H+ antiporter NhaD/arsenite permease-like protein
LIVLFPFHIPIPVPKRLANGTLQALARWRIIAPRQVGEDDKKTITLKFPMNFVTAPFIADVFLLAISAIGSKEVRTGTVGDDKISPLDIMIFFFTLAYIAISIDASGLIRWLAFKVLLWGGDIGHKLFLYLYAFFFVLGSLIGNDPIVLSGTAFLAYMTRVSSNIVHPRAWIHTQFAVANIASAILVSSNPTNLVLAGAFGIKFIDYTVRMIVPVVITAVVLCPFLLYVVFADPDLIPEKIEMHELPPELREKKPVNPNIPNARGFDDEEESIHTNDEQGKLMSLEEIMNPYIDWGGAAFGGFIMASTLIVLLALNAVTTTHGNHKIFWVTVPAAFVMLCWDVAFGWIHRGETRRIAAAGRKQVEEARAARQRAKQAEDERRANHGVADPGFEARDYTEQQNSEDSPSTDDEITSVPEKSLEKRGSGGGSAEDEKAEDEKADRGSKSSSESPGMTIERPSRANGGRPDEDDIEKQMVDDEQPAPVIRAVEKAKDRTLVEWMEDRYEWCQETFPTVTAVLSHLPYGLIPFAFCMFVLVQGLVTKGWVPLFARGWDAWVEKTGTVGAIGGMGFLSVVLCNVSAPLRDTPAREM